MSRSVPVIFFLFLLAFGDGIVSVLCLPAIIAFVVWFVALFACNVTMDERKNISVVHCVLSVVFLIVSVYLSLRFPQFMSEGQKFREIIPFLDVTFY